MECVLKSIGGWGTNQAMSRGSAIRYHMENATLRIPEGVNGMVASRGAVGEWVPCLMQGVKQGFQKLGYRDLGTLAQKIAQNKVELEKRQKKPKEKERCITYTTPRMKAQWCFQKRLESTNLRCIKERSLW